MAHSLSHFYAIRNSFFVDKNSNLAMAYGAGGRIQPCRAQRSHSRTENQLRLRATQFHVVQQYSGIFIGQLGGNA